MSKKTFLIQTKDGWPIFDFQWELLNQLRNDSRVKQDFNYVLCDWDGYDTIPTNPDWIPVGSVEFVHKCLLTTYTIVPRPLYIPYELTNYLCRDVVFNCSPEDVLVELDRYGKLFIKDASLVKGFVGTMRKDFDTECPKDADLFHVSEVIDITSEWRVFVHRGNILDCRNYSGDPLVFPNRGKVESMVEDFKSAPIAYTLDVAVTSGDDTVVIETHRFYSCGTYGFSSPKYPYMLSQAFFEIVRENGKVD